jgi:hypothetical protein
VPVLEGGEGLPQHIEHSRLIIDDQDSLRCLRVDRPSSLRPARSGWLGR